VGRHDARVSAWAILAGEELSRWQRTLNDMRAAGTGDFATLSVGVDSVRKLTESPLARA
jgi:NAD-specific glutamate dehydrogenase